MFYWTEMRKKNLETDEKHFRLIFLKFCMSTKLTSHPIPLYYSSQLNMFYWTKMHNEICKKYIICDTREISMVRAQIHNRACGHNRTSAHNRAPAQ